MQLVTKLPGIPGKGYMKGGVERKEKKKLYKHEEIKSPQT
jgi:hypothetical protein